MVTQDEVTDAFMIAFAEANNPNPTTITVGVEDTETIFPELRSKYPDFANCKDDEIFAYFDANGDGQISTVRS